MKVKMDELLDAMETNCDLLQWYYDTQKDKLIMVTDDCDDSIENDFCKEEIDSDEEDRFISIPTEHDIYEHSMMVSYSNKQSDEIRDILLSTLFKKGAFRRFKDTVFELDIRDDWYDYKREEYSKIAYAWAEKHGIKIV